MFYTTGAQNITLQGNMLLDQESYHHTVGSNERDSSTDESQIFEEWFLVKLTQRSLRASISHISFCDTEA